MEHTDVIKRVVALPNKRILIKGGTLYINGGYQSAGFDDSSNKAVLNLTGSPKVTSIKLFNEEETRKADFVEWS